MKTRIVKRGNSLTGFSPDTGSSFLIDNGISSTPMMLDVSLTRRCSMKCPYCYKRTEKDGYDMSMDDFSLLLGKMKEAKIFQVAYGGGNPNEHPQFPRILKMTKESGITPNYSTNGDNLNNDILMATSKYCGAMAISVHRALPTYERVVVLATSKVRKVNLQFVMMRSIVNELVSFLLNPPKWSWQINAIILLRYKNSRKCLEEEPTKEEYMTLFNAALKSRLKIGFDTCSYFLINKYLPEISPINFGFCEAARSSAYVDENLIMAPCSFDRCFNADDDLHHKTISDIFTNSPSFIKRRDTISKWHSCHSFSFSTADANTSNTNFDDRK